MVKTNGKKPAKATKRHLNRPEADQSNEQRRDVQVADFIPYACHFNAHTLLTKNGELLQIIKIVGFASEVVGNKKIKLRDAVREALFNSIPDDSYALWFHTIRRRKNLDPGGDFPPGFPSYLNRRWSEQHDWENKFINELYITIVREGQEVGIAHPLKFTRALWPDIHRRYREDFLFEAYADLEQVVSGMLYSLEQFGARRLSLEERDGVFFSEPLEFFSKIIHLKPMELPVPEQDLSTYLASCKVAFGFNVFEVRTEEQTRHFGAVLSIKEYREIAPHVLDQFMQLPQEMVISQCVDFVDTEAVKTIFDYQQYVARLSGDEEFFRISGLKEIAESDKNGPIDYAEHQLCITLTADSIAGVEQAVARAVHALKQLGILVMREDVRLEEVYWSQLPGNFEFVTRLRPINTQRVGGFASLHNFPAGQATRNHWGPAVSVFYTAQGTPYFFNFHVGDNGHTLILGPYGAGKTVLLNFLCSEAQKFNPRLFFFDQNRGAEIFIRALGGSYIRPIHESKKGSFKLNPLMLEGNNDETLTFWAEWLWTLMTYRNDVLSGEEIQALRAQAKRIAAMPKEQRRLYQVALDLHENGHTRLGQLLMPWCGEGHMAYLFDHAEDTLDMSGRTHGFDMGEVVREPDALRPLLLYLLLRLHQSLDGKRSMIVFDEAWQLLDNNVFMPKVGPWLDTFRQRNTMVIFASEMVDQIAESRISADIMRHIATEIYLPNPTPGPAYQQLFQLPEKEIALVRRLRKDLRHFLLRHNGEAVVGALDLSDMEDVLCIVSGTSENLSLFERAVEQAGDAPQQWLPVLQHLAMEAPAPDEKEAA